jgi:alkaline phosphatase D
VGQGWGINPEWGGLRLYETMLRAEPDLFINSGDTIYADQPLASEVKLDDGTVWKNVVTEAKSHVAQTLDDFRGCYQYNLTDEHMRRFIAAVPQIVQWDDHEVHDNWYAERSLEREPRFTVKSMALLAARARQAFGEYNPIPLVGDDPERIYRRVSYGPHVDIFVLDLRSYRSANNENMQAVAGDDTALMGPRQLAWLKSELAASRATWKVIASDLPIGIDVPERPGAHESFSNRDPGAPRGRELELADLFSHMKRQRIRNVVWITADVHYCAAHYYNPSRAAFTDFDPFWEFVAGPLNAGTFGVDPMDGTFGPEIKFIGVPPDMKPNRPPSAGLQFYGTLAVDARQRTLTAGLHDLAGKTLFSIELPPA